MIREILIVKLVKIFIYLFNYYDLGNMSNYRLSVSERMKEEDIINVFFVLMNKF